MGWHRLAERTRDLVVSAPTEDTPPDETFPRLAEFSYIPDRFLGVRTGAGEAFLQWVVCYVYVLYMKLAVDPATEGWLIGLTGADDEFEWDIGNLTKNRKHGVEPGDIQALVVGDFYFAGRIVEPVHAERRWLALGEDAAGRRLSPVFTRRGDRLRPISCRAMRPKESAVYEEARHQKA